MKRALHFLILLLISQGTAALAVPLPGGGPGAGAPSGHGPYLGVNVRTVTAERARSLGLKNASGVEVTLVDQDAPAGQAGVNEGDVILSLNGNPVESEEQLRRMVRQVPLGNSVILTIYRAGQQFNLQTMVTDRAHITRPASTFSSGPMPPPDFPPMPPFPFMLEFDMPTFTNIYISRSGMAFEELTPQLCQHFGMKNGRGGLLVRAIEKGSPAEVAGIRPGDIVIQVEKEWISDVDDWAHATIRRSGATNVTVLRDRRETTVSLKFMGHQRSAVKP
jgi:serine protease Do